MISITKEQRWVLKEKYNWLDSEVIQGKRLCTPNELGDISRLQSGEPVDYVIGWKEFLGCRINLSLKPLIPRVETEYWVNIVITELNRVSPESGETRILDLCCGSGCIGIALIKHFPNISVDFVDIDENALLQTKMNLKLNRESPSLRGTLPNRFQIIESDLFENLINRKYNYIFCNPPYVDPKGRFDKSLEFEPSKALFANDRGMYLIAKILNEFRNYLNPNGKLFMEFGVGQKLKIQLELKKLGVKSYKFNKDQYGKWRWVEVTYETVSPPP